MPSIAGQWTQREHEVDIVGLWWAIWDKKYLVCAITLACLAIALFFAFTMTPVYRVTVVVTPVYDKGLGNDADMGGLGDSPALPASTSARMAQTSSVPRCCSHATWRKNS